jgi:ribosomal protein S18 acetylase RimI-like enzyme
MKMYNPYQIREARPADIAEIIRLCGEHAEYEQADYDATGKEERLLHHLFADTPRLYCLLAVQDNEVLGYATYMYEFSTWDAGFYTHMDCLYLRPRARGQGIGEALVQEIAKAAKAQGCSLMQWQTPDLNVRAIKFYNRIGARAKGKQRFYLYLK